MISFFKEKRKQFNSYLSSHKKARVVYDYAISLIGTLISASLIAFSFRAFLSPSINVILESGKSIELETTTVISGGVSGIARMVALIAQMINVKMDSNQMYLVYSITYFILNIPVIYIGIRFISLRFGLFTLLNVALVTIFTSFVNLEFVNILAKNIACISYNATTGSVLFEGGLLPRAILAACCNGVATSIAFATGSSGGGMDTISYYLALRKSTNIGRYMLAINSVIIVLFSILSFIDPCVTGGFKHEYLADALLVLFFAIVYLLVLSLVIDAINRDNKKEQIQIITKEENLPKLLLANIPHGATIMRSKGAFTGEDRIVIYIIVSIYETKSVINLVRQADPKSFINITSVKQVYGRFFTRQVK